MSAPDNAHKPVRLWDISVRFVHWSFVLLLPAMWWSAENGDLELHRKLGMAFLTLLIFRIFWGFFGSQTARFGQFVKGPGAVIAYLRGTSAGSPVGHNPVGGWSVVALLGLLLVQTGLGLVAQDDDGLEMGPLNHLVSYDFADAATGLHHLLFNLIVLLVIIHVAAILFYLFVRRNNLIGPMVTGRKMVATEIEPPRQGGAFAFLLCLVLAGALTAWLWFGAPLMG